MKYFVLEHDGKELIFLHPRSLSHDAVCEMIQHIRIGERRDWSRDLIDAEVVAAGFVDDKLNCYGRSETLDKDSRGTQDSAILRRTLDGEGQYEPLQRKRA